MADQRSRRTFGPVVLGGLAGATLAAVGGSRAWAEAEAGGGVAASVAGYAAGDIGEMPAATALALVVLACWGVVLVTRRRVRRAVALLGAVAAVGLVVAVVVGWSSTVDDVRAAYAAADPAPEVSRTAWSWATALGSLVTLAASVAAVRFVPGWPEMGSRYDAPAGGSADGSADAPGPVAPEDATNIDLWKAMDEGRDPTA